MGLNFRKSIKIGKHTRINLSKSGIGVSTGVKGARVSVGPRGVRKTVGIPGTGIYYTKQESLNKLKDNSNPPGPPLYNNVPPPNKKNTGCGCFTVIAIIIIISAVVSGISGGNKDKTQASKAPAVKTQVSAPANNDSKKSSPAANTKTSASTSTPAVTATAKTNTSNSSSAAVVPTTKNAVTSSNTDQSQTVYITKSGKKYHSAGCRFLKKSSIPISLKDAKARGFTPCTECNPPQ